MRMHRMILIVGCCFVGVLLSSCGRKATPRQTSGEETHVENVYFYKPSGSNRPLYFFDTSVGKGGPFCFDPACEHRKAVITETGEVVKQGCPAYDYSELGVFLSGEHIYFFAESCLYRADRQGNNRKVITKLTNPYEGPTAWCFTDEALYMSYTLSYEYTMVKKSDGTLEWRAGKLREKPEAGLLRIPYSGEGEEVIYRTEEYYEGQVWDIKKHNEKICFCVGGMDRPSNYVDVINDPDWKEKIEEEKRHTFIKAYDYTIDNGETKLLFEPRQNNEGFYLFFDTYGFLNESGTLELYRYDGEKAPVPETQFWRIYPSSHDIIGWDKEKREGIKVSEETGKVLNQSPLTWEDFNLQCVIGANYYGFVGKQLAYISEEDFWGGNKNGIIILPGQNDE